MPNIVKQAISTAMWCTWMIEFNSTVDEEQEAELGDGLHHQLTARWCHDVKSKSLFV
jgi:hypothetical protein